MCVLALAWQASPRWRLVVAGNRDEQHARPAAAAARWQDAPGVIAGRDLQSGGTWLGVAEQGRFAVVTNLAGHDRDPDAPSRGMLVADILTGARPLDVAGGAIARFNPFSLLTIGTDAAHFATNRPTPGDRPLPPGVYGLSNGLLDEPWPRTTRVMTATREWIASESDDIGELLAVLGERRAPAVAARLPAARIDPTTLPVFIRNPVYGTRCSTVVAIGANGQGRFVERRFGAAGDVTGETALAFRWPTG